MRGCGCVPRVYFVVHNLDYPRPVGRARAEAHFIVPCTLVEPPPTHPPTHPQNTPQSPRTEACGCPKCVADTTSEVRSRGTDGDYVPSIACTSPSRSTTSSSSNSISHSTFDSGRDSNFDPNSDSDSDQQYANLCVPMGGQGGVLHCSRKRARVLVPLHRTTTTKGTR